jgi:hypothetical protein
MQCDPNETTTCFTTLRHLNAVTELMLRMPASQPKLGRFMRMLYWGEGERFNIATYPPVDNDVNDCGDACFYLLHVESSS